MPRLIAERPNTPPKPNFTQQNQWTLLLSNPFEVARPAYVIRWGNPHTKFEVFQVLTCLLAMADQRFAAGTPDARARALALYLEADDILGFPEMQDVKPVDPYQVDLPSPVLAAKRAQVDAALSKLRSGLSYLGTPLPSELTSAANVNTVAGQVRPTPYRFRILMERAKQLTALAQQFETQYLSAIERNESELEKLLGSAAAYDVADKTVELRRRGNTEAATSRDLALEQKGRSAVAQQHYADWIAAGPVASETQQIEAIRASLDLRNAVTGLDATAGALQASLTAVGSALSSFGAGVGLGVALGTVSAAKGVVQGFLNKQETKVQLAGLEASQERRSQEWQLQADLASHDVAIGSLQVTLAENRMAIAHQELVVADAQSLHARQMLGFLTTGKFTNAAFYEWLAGVLADTYAVFLKLAAATGLQAEGQLAFERQESAAGLLKSDYWRLPNTAPSSTDVGNNRRGITGSARLAQDLYALDQRAFESDRRVFNLSQSFSLALLSPVEFQKQHRIARLESCLTLTCQDRDKQHPFS